MKTTPPNLAGTKLGNYRLKQVLGRGNMGVVYLATDEALLRPTAVKVLTWQAAEHDPEAWFLAEARSVAKLNHPSVIQIYGVARHGPYCYIAMEYVEGVSADVMISREGPFSPERATEVIFQLASALELAHSAGIIHRDVKPANILIKDDGTAKLGDFGMAVSAVRPTATVRAGTPHYFAPEIWRGEPASIATDIYALGATYYYLLVGKPPIDGSTIATLSVAHQKQEIVAPPELASACMRVVRRCMAKLPAERYASARAVAWETRGVLRELEQTPAHREPARGADSVPPPNVETDPRWRVRGFEQEPFNEVDPRTPPMRGAPFDVLHQEIARRFQTTGTSLVIAGAPGSGRSTLARGAFAGSAERSVYLDLAAPSKASGSLVQRIARAFGAVASRATGGNEIDGLLEVLSSETRAPLVVIDGVADPRATAEIAVLARAARSTRYFNLLVVGPIDLAAELEPTAPANALIAVPPLSSKQTSRYIQSWLVATRQADAQPMIVTIDAVLIVGHRAEGNLRRINALMRRMIMTGGPVLTSWEAWTAPVALSQTTTIPPLTMSKRPAEWPTPEVMRLINKYRGAAGLAERGTGDGGSDVG